MMNDALNLAQCPPRFDHQFEESSLQFTYCKLPNRVNSATQVQRDNRRYSST